MSQRIARVNELIKRELSMVLERHYRFDGLIITVHDVVTTADLRQCFAYIGILGTAQDPQAIIDKLTKERGNIQRELHKRVILKHSPQIFFRLDTSIERGVRILNAIDSLPPPAPDPVEDEPEAAEAVE
jgi:ribosome-binding factor A